MATALVVGDPHFQTSNLPDCEELVRRVVETVKREKPNFVVVLGDILHTHETIHVEPLNLAVTLMKELCSLTYTVLIIGNHDYCNCSQYLTDKHGFNSLKEWKNIMIVDDVKYLKISSYTFYFCPYVPPGRFLTALNTKAGGKWKSADCVFAHQEFKGCQMGSIESKEGDEWKEKYPPVISGHIHQEQYVDPNIYYVGSAMQHSYADSTDKSVWLVTFDHSIDEVFRYEKIDLGLKKRRAIRIKLSELSTLDLTEYEDVHLKIILRGESHEFTKFRKSKEYTSLVRKGINVGFDPLTTNAKGLMKEFETIKNRSFDEIFSNLLSRQSSEIQKTYETVVASSSTS